MNSAPSPRTRHHELLAGVLLLLVVLRLGQLHVHAAMEHRRDDHEDDEQHEHDVDQRRDVDLVLRVARLDRGRALLVDLRPLPPRRDDVPIWIRRHARHLLSVAAFAEDVRDELRADVVHVDDELLDRVR